MDISPAIKKKLIWAVAAIVIAGGGWWVWNKSRNQGPGEGFIQGNGRIEATEIDVSTKLGGRVIDVLVREGDIVQAGQPLVKMQVDTLIAQRTEAQAHLQRLQQAVAAAHAQVKLRESDVAASLALERQREADLDLAQRRFNRTQILAKEGAVPMQELDDDRAALKGLQAVLAATRAQTATARAAAEAARADVVGARSAVEAGTATIARIDAEISDNELVAPRNGRVQLRLAEPGEVLGGGGRVLNLIDLSDVYMTFFVPEVAAGQVAIGSEARIVLDTAPDRPIPARITFVSGNAQFTPKTVETASERQKLMFRVKAQVAPEVLAKSPEYVKVGLPGVAWIKLDPKAEWPSQLALRPAE